MKYISTISPILFVVITSFTQLPIAENFTKHDKLRLSAVVNEPFPPYNARIQCWELHNHFSKYPTIGSSLQLANVSNVTYVELPADTEGLHNAPHPMLFVLLSGSAVVTLPDDPNTSLEIETGINSVIIATDTIGKGHYTRYIGERIAALQVPFKNGIPPEHVVLYEGQCCRPSQR